MCRHPPGWPRRVAWLEHTGCGKPQEGHTGGGASSVVAGQHPPNFSWTSTEQTPDPLW